jgi:hypothetical protein
MSFYVLLALAVTFVLILSLSVVPTINIPGPVVRVDTNREVAYTEYLRGEKVMYTNPIALNNALVAYHTGEKFIYDGRQAATWSYLVGEKSAVLSLEALNAADALYVQRMGEKVYK